MVEVVGVTFERKSEIFYFSPNNLKLNKKVTVIVETEYGLQFGTVVTDIKEIAKSDLQKELYKVIRISTKKDYHQHLKNQKESKKALNIGEKLAKKLNLPMKFISAEYIFNREQLRFYFLAQERIDFRELVKVLASIYRTRIELRQIGIRDKAKEFGGLGKCGRELCCSTFLKDIDNITIYMAKNQNLTLKPNNVNGACGRLLCCLKYENEHYQKNNELLPEIGSTIKTEQGSGMVIATDVLLGTYQVDIPKKGILEMEVK